MQIDSTNKNPAATKNGTPDLRSRRYSASANTIEIPIAMTIASRMFWGNSEPVNTRKGKSDNMIRLKGDSNKISGVVSM